MWKEVRPAHGDGDHRDRSKERHIAATDEREHDEPRSERDERRARERPEETGRDDDGERDGEDTATQRRKRDQERNDEEVAARERRQERRDEPAQERLVAPDVVDEVLGQPVHGAARLGPHSRAVVVVAELPVEVVDDAVSPPPADRDRVHVGEAGRRDERRDDEQRPGEAPQVVAPEQKRAPEEVGADGHEVVAKPECYGLVSGLSPERRLGHERVHDDDHGERDCEQVDDAEAERELSFAESDDADVEERDCQQDLLPGRDRSQRRAADPPRVERRHDGVVEREAYDEEVERDERAPPHGRGRNGEEHRKESELQGVGHAARVQRRDAGAYRPRSRRCGGSPPTSASRPTIWRPAPTSMAPPSASCSSRSSSSQSGSASAAASTTRSPPSSPTLSRRATTVQRRARGSPSRNSPSRTAAGRTQSMSSTSPRRENRSFPATVSRPTSISAARTRRLGARTRQPSSSSGASPRSRRSEPIPPSRPATRRFS